MFEEETNQLFLWLGQVLQCVNALHPEIRFLQMCYSSTPLPVEYAPSHLLWANGTVTETINTCVTYILQIWNLKHTFLEDRNEIQDNIPVHNNF